MDDIELRVRKIIAEHLNVTPASVIPTARLIEDLGADSLDVVELVMAWEECFHIEIHDDMADTISTVADAVNCVKQKTGTP